MIYSGSVVFIEPEKIDSVKTSLEGFKEIDIHAVGEDNQQIIISIETENDQSLEELTAGLKIIEGVIDVGHHMMHFEEEVDNIISGKTIPDLKGFQRSKRRVKNPLESQEV